jgi:nucleotide-binding universal stress UspA family protein
MTYSKIIIAVDSSEYSMKAAKVGFELAHQLNAKVALLFVIDEAMAMGEPEANITAKQAMLVLLRDAERTLDQLKKSHSKGKDIAIYTPEGLAKEDIIKTAEIWGADLIVMGTHGRTGLRHLIMGSVAENVVRHSKIPVLVVPSK